MLPLRDRQHDQLIDRAAVAVAHSIGLLPGDRQREGGFMKRSVAENL